MIEDRIVSAVGSPFLLRLTGRPRDVPNEVNFSLAERRAVRAKDVVKPDRRLVAVGQWRVPCKDRVGLTFYQTPIESSDMITLKDWQAGLEEALPGACHILGANER